MNALLPILLVVFLGIMYMASRRQKREARAVTDMQSALAVGDDVMTTSGLHGTITDLDEETVDLEIAPDVVTTWNRLAIRSLVAAAGTDDEDGDEDDDDTEESAEDVDHLAEQHVVGERGTTEVLAPTATSLRKD